MTTVHFQIIFCWILMIVLIHFVITILFVVLSVIGTSLSHGQEVERNMPKFIKGCMTISYDNKQHRSILITTVKAYLGITRHNK